MLLTKISQMTGNTHTMDIPLLTESQYQNYLKGDKPIQYALPYLTAEQREFILTGITAAEWSNAITDLDY